MKSKVIQRALLLGFILSVGAVQACGSKNSEEAAVESVKAEDGEETGAEEPRRITVAVAPGYYPITYADDDGNAAGYDVEVMAAVDALLPDYEFVYEIADKETMNVGVETGTYQIGVNSLFKTEERLETYLMTENVMGYAAVGAIYREDAEEITSFSDIAAQGLKIYPYTASGGIPTIVANWNEEHPDEYLDMGVTSALDTADALDSVRSGEYGVFIHLIAVYNLWDEETTAGLTVSDPLAVVETYPIINKSEEELAAQIDEALATLREDGTLAQLSVDAFGYDIFALAE